MLMIPLPFVLAAGALSLIVREWVVVEPDRRNGWFMGFLGLLAFQEILIGARFGYGVDWLKQIQPATAVLIPPFAYLSFRRPQIDAGTLVHVLPLPIIMFVNIFLLDATDAFLALNNLGYAAMLARLGLRGSDALGWADFGRMRMILGLLWLVCGLLLVSGITDAVISYDSWITNGFNVASIAGWATAIGTMATLIGVTGYMIMTVRKRTSGKSATNTDDNTKDGEDEKVVFDQLLTLLKRERLYLDPDINLNRIARRLALPARDVSRAINSQTGQNVSQFVNRARVMEACSLLTETDMPIIQIAHASGFNTKSNFNREFARNMSGTPSQWRAKMRRTQSASGNQYQR